MPINSPFTPCSGCGAVGPCCEVSKDRNDTATSLARLVARQAESISSLRRQLQETKQVIADLRGLVK